VDADLVGGEFVVDLGHSINLAFNLLLVEDVQEDLDVLLTVEGDSGALSSDGSRVALLLNIKSLSL
jgi:predicted methyltransferase MtxX (methanogen marker protein 4)